MYTSTTLIYACTMHTCNSAAFLVAEKRRNKGDAAAMTGERLTRQREIHSYGAETIALLVADGFLNPVINTVMIFPTFPSYCASIFPLYVLRTSRSYCTYILTTRNVTKTGVALLQRNSPRIHSFFPMKHSFAIYVRPGLSFSSPVVNQ